MGVELALTQQGSGMEQGYGKGSKPPPLVSASESNDQITQRETGLLRAEPVLTLRGD